MIPSRQGDDGRAPAGEDDMRRSPGCDRVTSEPTGTIIDNRAQGANDMTKAHEYVLDPSDTWHVVTGLADYPANVYGVTTYARDLIERRNGIDVRTWSYGAYQVRGGGRTKTFKGETAWSDAAREHTDRITKARYAA